MIALMQGSGLLWALLDAALQSLLPAKGGYFASVLIETVSYLSYFMLPAILFLPLSQGRTCEPIRFDIRMPAFFPLLVVSGFAATYVAAKFNGWVMDLVGYGGGASSVYSYSGGSDPQAVALFITVSLAPAFCEEFLFRGIVYGNLRRYGIPFAVTVSALLFALMHENIAQTFYTFVGGIAMALCYELSGSIWCGTFLHLVNNLNACVSEILLARMGNAALPILHAIDLGIMGLGLASVLGLVWIYRRRRPQPQAHPRGSLIGDVPETLPLLLPEKSDGRATLRDLLTPGMIVYGIAEIVLTGLNAYLAF